MHPFEIGMDNVATVFLHGRFLGDLSGKLGGDRVSGSAQGFRRKMRVPVCCLGILVAEKLADTIRREDAG